MITFKSFKKVCSELLTTCEHCNYSFDLGVCSDKSPFLKIYGHEDKQMIGSVILNHIPIGVSCYVSLDPIRDLVYLYIYPDVL